MATAIIGAVDYLIIISDLQVLFSSIGQCIIEQKKNVILHALVMLGVAHTLACYYGDFQDIKGKDAFKIYKK